MIRICVYTLWVVHEVPTSTATPKENCMKKPTPRQGASPLVAMTSTMKAMAEANSAKITIG